MRNLEIGVGPMSLEVINSVVKYANEKDTEIMLIASRNQIECESLGGGYVGGLDSRKFVDYVRYRDLGDKIKICRDHCGPFLNDVEKGMSYEEAMERTRTSLVTDMYCGFNYIHVDTSAAPDPYEAAEYMFGIINLCSAPIQIEFGTEENIGTAVSAEKFERDVQFLTAINPGFIKPLYVVGQTGSLVKSNIQAGKFDEDVVRKLVEIADKHGVRLKEHNADYISKAEVDKRRQLGVAAINVAPEFGVAQTKMIIKLAMRHKLLTELAAFKNVVVNGNKWKKWEYGDFDEYHQFICAGHYHFTSHEYLDLVHKLSKYVNVQKEIDGVVYHLLDTYVCE